MMKNSGRVFLMSLGCDKNRIDAEIMARTLQDGGYTLSDDPFASDAAIVNTCGFIEASKKEALDAVFEMARIKEDPASALRAVLVTGCLAERYREEAAELLPEADAVIGIGENGRILEWVRESLSGGRPVAFAPPKNLPVDGARLCSTPPHYAYLKIAEGCSNRCTYCAIPAIRGRYRSRPMENILAEAGVLAADGVRELILVAQDTTAYGTDLGDGAPRLPELLRALSKIDGLWKVRILYAYPERITDELIETIATEDQIAKYLDIPMQHANGDVLRRMGRFGDDEHLLALLERLRAAVPDIAVRSSFIVGFPGETEEQFQALLAFLKAAQLDRAGCFAYSAEEGTAAARLKEQLPDEVKRRRVDGFMQLQSNILFEKQQKKIGLRLPAIVDGFDEAAGRYAARTEFDAPEVDTLLYIESKKPLLPGAVVAATVTGIDGVDLLGTV